MPDINSLSPADVLTPVGFAIAAGLVTGLVEIFKRLATSVVTGREQVIAAILTALLVAAAIADTGTSDAGSFIGLAFTAVLSWYSILRIAMGVHDDVAQKPDSLTGPTGAG